ncbi:GNAT family N-acetyltransferase [Pontibacter arcticus]|uniref:GNAT family N-acetyltransferase n=1 Tax=Pontibacter arcticus TaxID=2080288 RepID=A0A364RDQ6_9BACT|nr:GNAT family N-acetyltransferase [Pontibacter arcticus]RAU82409.1 GNAT family N-acetyltransferase [Pontibacter arcticus]
MLKIKRTDASDPDFKELVVSLDQDLKVRDGEDYSFYAQYNKLDTIKNTVVAYLDDVAVGCGAVKMHESGVGEVKRMFVRPGYRGQGIAGKILTELESWATELQFSKLILETGMAQPEAIALYTKSGYIRMPNYGQYENVENSVCMQKQLSVPEAP